MIDSHPFALPQSALPPQSDQIATQNYFIQQLNRLNSSLKIQLDECHKYIHTLQKELFQNQNSTRSSIPAYQHSKSLDSGSKNEQLVIRVQKLENKLNDKRGKIKRLEAQRQEIQHHLYQSQRQKQQIWENMNNLQYLLDNRSTTDREAVTKLQNSLAQQRQTIQLYYKELNGKTAVIEKIYKKLQDLQRQRGVIINQNEGLRMVNFTMAQKQHENQKRAQQNQIKLQEQMRQMQTKYSAQISQLKKSNKILKQQTNHTKNAIINSLSMKLNKIQPLAKVSCQSQNHPKQQTPDQVQFLQKEIAKQRQIFQRLRNDLMNMKLENSSLVVKNNQLQQEVIRLQRSRNEFLAKATDCNNSRDFGQDIQSVQKRYYENFRRSAVKNSSLDSSATKRVPKSPQPHDHQVPVHDKSSLPKKLNFNKNQDLIQTRKGNKINHISSTFLNYK